MPPKKKGGKKQPQDDDAFWESKAAKASPVGTPGDATPAGDLSDDDDFSPTARPAAKGGKKGKGGGGGGAFGGFAGMMVEGDDDDAEEEDDEPAPAPKKDDSDEEDGLLAMAKKAAQKKGGKKDKKKGKKGAAGVDDDDYFVPDGGDDDKKEDEPDLAAPRGAVEATDDWMEEEFGPSKGKKGKKGGNKKQQQQKKPEDDSDDEVEAVAAKVKDVKIDEPAPKPASPAPAPAADNDEDEDGAPTRLLSKKEKEKLKKEKEKAKKKAQAAAKKAQEPTPAPAAEAPPAAAPADGHADDAADDAGEGGASSKNKKKKKKKAGAAAGAEDEPAPAAAAGKKGKGGPGGAQLAALRAMMEAQQKAREEAERAEREERERIEEEERKAAEEARLKEEERLRKKEKEKAKKEQLKREGKLLTPKQKAERAAAEARRQALLASGGVAVAGLQQQADAPKKVSYGARKRAPGKKDETASPAESKAASPEREAKPEPAVATPEPAAEPVKVEEEEEDVKDSWDASSSEDEKPAEEKEDVKDSWDASSSEDEEEAKPKAASATKAASAPKAANGKAAAAPTKSAAKPAAKAAPAAKGKKAAPVEESSSEDDSSDDDSDDSDDSDDDSDDSDDDSDEDGMTAVERQEAKRKAEAKARRLARDEAALAERSKENLRSPICVIMGHVDTGKTKLLDKIRATNVQEGEAGGITQQIGATYFPMEAIQKRTRVLGDADLKEYKLPGLLVIDTPGHESFTNLRQRGSSLCNIAILVVDIMHGLEPQTLESIRLLRDGKTPFIVALNKIDRLYGWQPMKDGGFLQTLDQQNKAVQREYEKRLSDTVVAFAEQGLNAVPYYDNKNLGRNVSLVPTSAHTGEGVPDLLMLLVKLTQERMAGNLMYISTLQCTVLEVKVIEGLGTTIDVVLVNGYLHEGDKIVLCGLNGAIVTQVRALLTPQPMKELRIKGQYVHHKSIKAAMGVKIVAPDLEKAIAGSRLLVCGEDDDEDELREEVMSDLTNLLTRVDTSGRGVFVQASTLGSLEALLEFLKSDAVKIPVSGINIGPVHKKDVMRCATMLEKAPELAVILCFDVPVDKDAEEQADKLGIKIFKADIIYHLFDQFMAYKKANEENRRAELVGKAVFPCRLRILQCFAKRDPIILGCDIEDGNLRVGTPLAVVKTDPTTKQKEIISLGKVTGLEINHKPKDIVKKHEAGAGVAVKIEHASYESAKQFGRHFDEHDEVVSLITRESIDVLKSTFRDDVSKAEWQLIAKYLKPLLNVA
ncbi:hypothetical protein Rhopal_002503-T1 [Rhodotorula paludigena]|uniref:Eukaryotic translation initiation factor 5B n=1 Tax=Rhodotorula paludigena TaxID=86838 RepID=A0AAV5GJ58_9BASI|nr:hypothetical protein Rhopal_002503-T1 [Rhodotorula paludigena]